MIAPGGPLPGRPNPIRRVPGVTSPSPPAAPPSPLRDDRVFGIKPENRALLVFVTAVIAVTAAMGVYLLASPSPPTTLVVPWLTVFQAPAGFWFNVTPPGGTLVGAWSSTGKTCVFLIPYGSTIPPAVINACVAEGTASGTLNANVSSEWSLGYALYFLSDSPVTVRVAQTIQVVY